MAPLNVLWILSCIPETPEKDGMSRWLDNVLKTMRPLVSRIDIIGQSKDSTRLGFWEKYADYYYSVPQHPSLNKRMCFLLGWDHARIVNFNTNVLREAKQRIRRYDFDLVVLLGHGTNVYLPYIRAKHIMMVPLDAPSGLMANPPRTLTGKIKTWINRQLIPWSENSYNAADSVLVVSERDKELLIRSGVRPEKVLVFPLVIDPSEFIPREVEHKITEPSMLFTGVLNFYPNEDAIQHLVKDIYLKYHLDQSGIKCRIAGRFATPLIHNLAENPGVELWENMPDLRVAFDRSRIYVAPMRVGLGMKTKILEAMAMQMPIIGYPLAFNGFADPGKFALVCNSPEEMSNAIKLLINSPETSIDFGRKARNYAIEHHGMDRVSKFILGKIRH